MHATCGDFRDARLLDAAQPLLSVGLTSNSLNRSNDVGRRNREENNVLLERCGCRCITLTRRYVFRCDALNLSRYWKTGLSAESQPHRACRVLGLDCLLANGSLSRAAAMPHSAV